MTAPTRARCEMDDKRIAELRALCEAATPGPWTAKQGTVFVNFYEDGPRHGGELIGQVDHQQFRAFAQEDADTAFIAAVRTAVPELLDALEAARAGAGALREALPMSTVCGEIADVDEIIYRCQLPPGHEGDHVADKSCDSCAALRAQLAARNELYDEVVAQLAAEQAGAAALREALEEVGCLRARFRHARGYAARSCIEACRCPVCRILHRSREGDPQ